MVGVMLIFRAVPRVEGEKLIDIYPQPYPYKGGRQTFTLIRPKSDVICVDCSKGQFCIGVTDLLKLCHILGHGRLFRELTGEITSFSKLG